MKNSIVSIPAPKNEIEAVFCSMLEHLGVPQYWIDFRYLSIERGVAAIGRFIRKVNLGHTLVGSFEEELACFSIAILLQNKDSNINSFCMSLRKTIARHYDVVQAATITTTVFLLMNEYIKRIDDLEGLFFDVYPDSGDFALPWDCVEFNDYAILYYHPKHLKDAEFPALVLREPKSKKTFGSLIPAFEKHQSPIVVRADNGRIVQILNSVDLSEIINIVAFSGQCPNLSFDEVRKRYWLSKATVVQPDSKEKQGLQDSVYLSYLSKNHLPQHPILCCNEWVTHRSDSSSFIEHAYLFLLEVSCSKNVIVFENENVSRATYVFVTECETLDIAIGCIVNFFTSTLDNKRETLHDYEHLFKKYCVIDYSSVLHTDFIHWKINLETKIKQLCSMT